MSSKVAHVIIVGLNEEERQELDKMIELAEKLQNIDIIYIGRREPSITLAAENDQILGLHARFKGPKQPMISYPYGDRIRHKLPVAIMSLWKARSSVPSPRHLIPSSETKH